MTPKEKAKELVDKFDKAVNTYTNTPLKKCALIAVDEILYELDEVLNVTGSSFIFEVIDYWMLVKQEIELL